MARRSRTMSRRDRVFRRPARSGEEPARRRLPEGDKLRAELREYDRALALRPGDFVARALRALSLGLLHRWPEALRDSDAALARVPHGHPLELHLLGLRSMARREMGRLSDALADLDRLLSIQERAEYLAARGEVHRRVGRLDRALGDLDRSVELHPEDPFAFISRGRVHLTEGRAAAAVQDFDTALELDPEDVSAYHHRARARRAQGDEPGARADWDAALRVARASIARDPQNVRARAWIAWIHAEGLHEGVAEAVREMEQLRAELPDADQRADLQEILARVHYRAGNLAEALRLQESAHALCPEDVEVAARLEEIREACAREPRSPGDRNRGC